MYIALVALFVGGEVEDNTGNTIRLSTCRPTGKPRHRSDWNMGPVPGYFNRDREDRQERRARHLARILADKLNDPVDPGWKGSWNGFFGKNQFNADQETVLSGRRRQLHPLGLYPDTTDTKRRGLGMLIDVRALQWSQASVADAVFFVQEVKNDGTKDIKKTGVTLWLADFVGGDGDSQDDSPSFDLILDIAFSLDADGRSSNPAFANAFVGAAATLYLETPGNADDRIDNDGDSPEFSVRPEGDRGDVRREVPGTTEEVSGEPDRREPERPHRRGFDVHPLWPAARRRLRRRRSTTTATARPGPVVTQQMVTQASLDPWKRWPPNPETDAFAKDVIHLIDRGDRRTSGRRSRTTSTTTATPTGTSPTSRRPW